MWIQSELKGVVRLRHKFYFRHDALLKKLVKFLQSGSTPPVLFSVREILLMILRYVCTSTVNSGCIASTINAATNLLSSTNCFTWWWTWTEIKLLLFGMRWVENFHAKHSTTELEEREPNDTCYYWALSLPTLYCALHENFLLFEEVFFAVDKSFSPTHNLHLMTIPFSFSSTISK